MDAFPSRLGNVTASQLYRARRGVGTSRSRLAPNTRAAASARMLRLAPNIVVRTGTAVRPRPGSRAIRTPAVALGGNDDRAMTEATAEGRRDRAGSAVPSAGPATPDAPQAGTAPRSATASKVPRAPTSITGQSKDRPGFGSATRAMPVGASGERRKPTTIATAAPIPPIAPARIMPMATN